MATIAQITLLGLCREMDVKGTCSGKYKIFSLEGRPQDILGYMLQRLGYTLVPDSNKAELSSQSLDPEGNTANTYTQVAKLLEISQVQLTSIWREIDREDSTNESIRKRIKQVCKLENEFPDS